MPNDVLSQLGARIQHALRAFTPKDQKAVKSAADTTDNVLKNANAGKVQREADAETRENR